MDVSNLKLAPSLAPTRKARKVFKGIKGKIQNHIGVIEKIVDGCDSEAVRLLSKGIGDPISLPISDLVTGRPTKINSINFLSNIVYGKIFVILEQSIGSKFLKPTKGSNLAIALKHLGIPRDLHNSTSTLLRELQSKPYIHPPKQFIDFNLKTTGIEDFDGANYQIPIQTYNGKSLSVWVEEIKAAIEGKSNHEDTLPAQPADLDQPTTDQLQIDGTQAGISLTSSTVQDSGETISRKRLGSHRFPLRDNDIKVPESGLPDISNLQNVQVSFPDFEILGVNGQTILTESKLAGLLKDKLDSITETVA